MSTISIDENAPQSQPHDFAANFNDLAKLPLWITWRSEKRATSKGERWTKIPYAIDGGKAEADNPSTWMTRAEAEKCARERHHQLGIMFGQITPDRQLGGIDLDACFADEGDLLPWAQEVFDLVPSYAEISPSGKGLKLFFLHDPASTTKERWRKHVQKPNPAGGKDFGIEMYFAGRWFAVTGDIYLDRSALMVIDVETLRKVERVMLRFDGGKKDEQQHIVEAIDHMANADLSWEDWNTRGMAIYAASGGAAWGYDAFRRWSQKSAKYDESACDERWQHWRTSPPTRLGAGTIFHFAKVEGGYKPNGDARRHQSGGAGHHDETSSTDAPGKDVFEAEVKRLARLDALSFERVRRERAKALHVSVGFLEKMVAMQRPPKNNDDLPEIEPWPDAVDGARLLDEIAAAILRHVSMSKPAADAAVLWIMLTHCFDAVQIAPRLAVKSPTHECGKTTFLEVISSLVPRPMLTSNLTSAAFFRAIEKWHPTLIADEADTYLPDNEELRGMLNSSHKRASAYITRCIGEEHNPTHFSTWCPLVMARIGDFHPTLASRSIVIPLQRLKHDERVERFRAEKQPNLTLARQAARWASDVMEALHEADPDLPVGWTGRWADNWRPLLAIADQGGGDWPDRARRAAGALSKLGVEDLLTKLLADIRTALGDEPWIASTNLVKVLQDMEDRPWPEFGRARKPITPRAIARLLAPLVIKPKHACWGNGYLANDFDEAFSRYLSP
jgi:hypothetical protein